MWSGWTPPTEGGGNGESEAHPAGMDITSEVAGVSGATATATAPRVRQLLSRSLGILAQVGRYGHCYC